MALGDWKVPRSVQPRPDDQAYDLDRALSCVVTLSAIVPGDAFTAETLGTERAGNGVVIREDGLVVTIGYLVTEAETVWLSFNDGRVVPGDVVLVDAETGFGLVQILERDSFPALPIGRSQPLRVGTPIVVAGGGGRQRAVSGKVVSKQLFAGYWEYLLEEAIFTAPSHPNWGGTALIGPAGELVGIGSLQLQQERAGRAENVNLCVPIDLLAPLVSGRMVGRPGDSAARPWLGFYVTEVDDRVVVAGVASGGPAETAGLQTGDIIMAVGETETRELAALFRAVWAVGPAGVLVPLRLHRTGRTIETAVRSVDRRMLLKRPRLH